MLHNISAQAVCDSPNAGAAYVLIADTDDSHIYIVN